MLEIGLLSFFVWLAYWGAIHNGFVSDDIAGLQNYDGKLKKFDYGHLNKWLLYKLLDKSPIRNHLFSIILHNANVLLLYFFLLGLLPQRVAFLASILFAVSPIGVQAIAWISGRGYPISLFFTLLGLNLVILLPKMPLNSPHSALITIGYGCLYYVAIVAQFATLMTFMILGFLGNYFLAIIGFILSIFAGLGIIKEVINIRATVFKEQNLGSSTFLKLSKIIVAIKTLAYYTRLCVFPKRLGLYHTFEYHYSDKTEKENKWFWFGFLILLGFGGIYWKGDLTLRFGILWYLTYIFVFLNWITIHQFVAERYLYIASIGIYILLAWVLQFSPLLASFIIGLYLMRTWVHLPTYQNEVSFYQSNVWNFPDSEVAFSNLGVTYLNCGLMNSGLDMWAISNKINPDYDVGYYNIFSTFRQMGNLPKAREFLDKAINSKTCHFKGLWIKELQQLDHEIQYVNEFQDLKKLLDEIEKDPSKQSQVQAIRTQLEEINNLHTLVSKKRESDLVLIKQDEQQLKTKLIHIEKKKEELSKSIPLEEIFKARDYNFSIVKESVKRLQEVKNETSGSGIQAQG